MNFVYIILSIHILELLDLFLHLKQTNQTIQTNQTNHDPFSSISYLSLPLSLQSSTTPPQSPPSDVSRLSLSDHLQVATSPKETLVSVLPEPMRLILFYTRCSDISIRIYCQAIHYILIPHSSMHKRDTVGSL